MVVPLSLTNVASKGACSPQAVASSLYSRWSARQGPIRVSDVDDGHRYVEPMDVYDEAYVAVPFHVEINPFEGIGVNNLYQWRQLHLMLTETTDKHTATMKKRGVAVLAVCMVYFAGIVSFPLYVPRTGGGIGGIVAYFVVTVFAFPPLARYLARKQPRNPAVPAWVECPLLLPIPFLLAGVNMVTFVYLLSDDAEKMRANALRYIGCNIGCCVVSILVGVLWDYFQRPNPSMQDIIALLECCGDAPAIAIVLVLPLLLLVGQYFLQLFAILGVTDGIVLILMVPGVLIGLGTWFSAYTLFSVLANAPFALAPGDNNNNLF